MIGIEIKNAREAKKLTQEQLGSLIGVSKSAINQFERQNKTPNLDHLLKLSEVLELPIERIMGLDKKVSIVADGEEYTTRISSKDLQILSEIKLYPNLYKLLCEDTERKVKLMSVLIK